MQLWFSSLAGKDDDFKFRTRDDGDSPESNYSNRDGENTPPCTPCGSQCQLPVVPELECPKAPRRRRSEAPIPAANVRHLFRKLIVNRVSSFLKIRRSRIRVTASGVTLRCCTAIALGAL